MALNSESISVILPVRNRQDTLSNRIFSLLDYLVELSSQVEVIVIDDASNDATPEILDDLRRRFPQIQSLRHANQLGPTAAVQPALSLARGEFVFVQESYEPIELEDLKQLWQLRTDRGLVMARARTRSRRIDESLLQKLHAWGQRLEGSWIGKSQPSCDLQMYRREVVANLAISETRARDMEIAHYSHRRVSSPKLNAHKSHANQPTSSSNIP